MGRAKSKASCLGVTAKHSGREWGTHVAPEGGFELWQKGGGGATTTAASRTNLRGWTGHPSWGLDQDVCASTPCGQMKPGGAERGPWLLGGAEFADARRHGPIVHQVWVIA